MTMIHDWKGRARRKTSARRIARAHRAAEPAALERAVRRALCSAYLYAVDRLLAAADAARAKLDAHALLPDMSDDERDARERERYRWRAAWEGHYNAAALLVGVAPTDLYAWRAARDRAREIRGRGDGSEGR